MATFVSGSERSTSIDSNGLICTAFVEEHRSDPSILKQMKQQMFHIGHGDCKFLAQLISIDKLQSY